MLALALALLASACGEETEKLSAEQLISRGDEICKRGQERFAEVQQEPPANATEAREQTDELVEVANDELDELRDLRPPDELGDAYDAYLQARGSALELLEQGRDAAEDKDADAYDEAQIEAAADQPERLKLARAVGFKVCSTS